MPRAVIIDDEPLARSIVAEYLEAYPEIEISAECNDGFEALKAIHQFQPDIIFLDVQMPKINGFEMLELLETPPAVIFTTAFDEYAIRAFENQAIDYLLKPFSKERFDRAISQWRSRTKPQNHTEAYQDLATHSNAQHRRVVVKNGGKIKVIPVDEVQYLEASDDYVRIVTEEGTHLKNRTMAYFEKSLDPSQFVRTHRSYIINIQYITRIDPYEKDSHIAILKTGLKVPVSRAGYQKLKEQLGI